MKVGDRVQTNRAFSKLFSGGATWRGELMLERVYEKRRVWIVAVDGMAKRQYIAEKFLVKEGKR